MTPVDATTQLSEGQGTERDYIKQTSSGTFPNTTYGSWHISWIAPPVGSGPVHFYIAGNAANNDRSSIFDYVYTLLRTVPEAVPVSVDSGSEFDLRLFVSPNPIDGAAFITYTLPGFGPVELRLFNAEGRAVRLLQSGFREAGTHQLVWDRQDTAGKRVPAGFYWCRLIWGDETRTSKILVIP